MREIKFRAWHKEDQKIYYGGFAILSSGSMTGQNWSNSNSELMQYTGLKDKNGKEIYEGDIVKWYGYQGVVTWVFDGTPEKGTTPKRIGAWYFNNGYTVVLPDGEWVNLDSKYELIGNIYDNPELIGGAVKSQRMGKG